ncbi:MAG TPA: NADH-quinone oxidoreductase subunit D [Candidatus Eisenbacteria bacterium]|uniref:NADH-quinone oxidoreductase subunit D n=1 Tax=Eiseniibacteriota bacterium TaxID=2212470 RepID=A0A7V2AUA5_UNCEI|nr:NADH-quinone oxidoreductase subunit D [Candidatus Eisenbacteria bacterium]
MRGPGGHKDPGHPFWSERPAYDLESEKYLKIWQGPQHPGVTGNMALELVVEGDIVVDCRVHVGYLHRGFEKLMERRKYMNCFPIVCRICVPEPDCNEYLFAAAVEELAGIEIPERAKWIRAITLELARIASLTMGIGGQAGSFGLGTVGQWCLVHRDYVLDLFEELTGHRIYHMYILPGGVRHDLTPGFAERTEAVLRKIEKLMDDVQKVLFDNAVIKARTNGLGVIPREWIDPFGIVGTNARGAGSARDVRKDYPYLVYDRLDFDVITGSLSDVYGRSMLRKAEILMACGLVRQMLREMPAGPVRTRLPNPLHWRIPAGETYVRAESGRGEMGYLMVSDGSGYPRRVHVRGPSYTHAMALFEEMIRGISIADVAGLMVSLQTCPPEIER